MRVPHLIPRLPCDRHDQRRRHVPVLPLDDLAAESVDAGELRAGDATDERLAQLDVLWLRAHHVAHGEQILVEACIADLRIELRLFFVREVHRRTIGGSRRDGISFTWSENVVIASSLPSGRRLVENPCAIDYTSADSFCK